MSHARIFQKPKNAMQSGRKGTDLWVLEFQPVEAKRPDPLTGWAGSGDTRSQISLSFPTELAGYTLNWTDGIIITTRLLTRFAMT